MFRERFGKEKWQRITRENLQFESEVLIAPGSSRPPNLDVERDQWLKFLAIIGQSPQLALSKELLKQTANKFEGISERALDELNALANRMVEINANQAGRNQEGPAGTNATGVGPGGNGNGRGAKLMAALMGRSMQGGM